MISVGGSTEVEVKEKKDGVDDAVRARQRPQSTWFRATWLLRAKAAEVGKLRDENARYRPASISY